MLGSLLPRGSTPSTPEHVDQSAQIARALQYTLYGITILVVFASVAALIADQQKVAALTVNGLILALCVVVHRELSHNRVQRASMIFVMLSWIIVVGCVSFSGGLSNLTPSLFVALIAMAALFLNWQFSVAMTGATVLYALGLNVLQLRGIELPVLITINSTQNWLLFVQTLLLAQIPVIIMSRGLVKALGYAQRQLKQREAMQVSLRQSEERYRAISDMIWDYAFAYNVRADGQFQNAWIIEDAFKRVTGYEWSEIGDDFRLYHPEDIERVRQDVAQTISGKATSGEYRIVRPDGTVRWLHIQRKIVWDKHQSRVIRVFGAAEDITERKNAQAASHRSEEMMRALLDATADVAFLLSREGVFLTVNRAFASFLGSTPEALVGTNAFALMGDDLAQRRRQYFEAAVKTGQPQRFEDSTNDTEWWDNNVYPILSPDGAVTAFAVYSRNITEQKDAERMRLQFAVEKERHEAFQSMIGGVSHDIKTPLMVISTSLYALEKSVDLDVRKRSLDNIRKQSHRLREFVEDLLAVSKLDSERELRLTDVDVEQLLSDLDADLAPIAAQKRQTFTTEVAGTLPNLRADIGLLRRAFVNLIQNAIMYTPEAGQVTVRALMDGDAFLLEVADTGIGISEDDLPNIFQPFYRANQREAQRHEGTGLGLAIVQDVVRRHSGHVTVESKLGVGSTFRVVLPTPSKGRYPPHVSDAQQEDSSAYLAG